MSRLQSSDADSRGASEHPSESWHPDDENMSDESEESEAGDLRSESTSNSTKKPRSCSACLSCRRQKTRCEYPDDTGPCKLCIKYNRECIKAPPRRRRQKTTVRIADLEQKIQNLTDALVDKGQRRRDSQPSDGTNLLPAAVWNGPIDMAAFESRPPEGEAALRPPRNADVVDKGLVDKATAHAAFERYRTKMSRFFAYLTIPPEITAEQYRRKKPLLFSLLVLAAISSIKPDLAPKVAEDIMKTFGDRILYRGDRSLDLVQSLTCFVCFYSRTLQKKDLNFYQYIHVACTMALDLGLGRRVSKTGVARYRIPENEQLEARRAWLGCYYMAANAAISLRHPPFIRWTPYVEECLEVLSTHPQAVPTDLYICDYIRITRIVEDAATIFSMDDPGCNISLRDPKTQYQLGALEKQLQRWRREARGDLSSPQSRSIYASTNLYIHEIALHLEHDIDKFKSPPQIDEVTQSLEDLDIAPVRIDSLCTCLESVHEIFDALLGLDVDTLRCLPNLFFVRTGYAAVILKSLSDVFDSNAWGNLRSQAIDVKFDYYIDRTIKTLAETGKDGRSNIAAAFAMVLAKVKDVHDKSNAPRTVSAQRETDVVPSSLSSLGSIPPVMVPSDAQAYPITSVAQQADIYGYSSQQALPAEFNFNDFDTNMFDISAFQTFNPNFGIYDFAGMYGTEPSSATNT